MTHHPHIYMIVPGRGMLSVRALSKLFRHLFLTRLIDQQIASAGPPPPPLALPGPTP